MPLSITFSHSLRACIGEILARSEMLAILAALVGRFRIEHIGTSGYHDMVADKVKVEHGIVSEIMREWYIRMEVLEGS